jgi:hypothetical protein
MPTISISRGIGKYTAAQQPLTVAAAGSFEVVYPDGTTASGTQVWIVGVTLQPVVFRCDTCSGNVDGYVFRASPSGQTFTYENQVPRNQIGQISAAGITSFDSNLTAFTNVAIVSVGFYVNALNGDGAFPFVLASQNNTITSFNTELPPSIYSPSGRPGSIFIFANNTVPCSFNPVFRTGIHRWVFCFRNNSAQETLTLNAEHILSVNIFSNSNLTSVIVNNLKYQNFLSGALYDTQISSDKTGVNITSNSNLTSVQLNGTNLDTQTTTYRVYLNSNALSESTFNENNITYPPNRRIEIYLLGNKFINFTPQFTNSNIRILDISGQQAPKLSFIPDNSSWTTTLTEFYFQNNSISQCPYLPPNIQRVNMTQNPIICQPDRPNFRTTMTYFAMGNNTSMNFDNWQPNVTTAYNQGLSNCNNISTFILNTSNLTGWTHQFPATLPANSALNFTQNRIVTLDMSKLSGFESIDLTQQRIGTSNYTLTGLTNLHLNTTVKTLTLNSNSGFNPPNDTSIIQGPWPAQINNVQFSNINNITSWSRSFAGYATNPATAQLIFKWWAPNQTSGYDSVSFILRDLITATTKTAGSLTFGDVLGTSPRGMIYPLSTQDAFTQACYNCLVANTTTACNSSLLGFNLSTSNTGRGFSIGFAGIT